MAGLSQQRSFRGGRFEPKPAKYGDFEVLEATRSQALEDENAELKRLLVPQLGASQAGTHPSIRCHTIGDLTITREIPAKSRDGLHGAGSTFKRRREARGLSAEAVAHGAHIPINTLRKIESNRRNASRSDAEEICRVLETRVDDVMNEVVGLHEFLPVSHGLRLVTYFLRKDGVESPLEVSPSISLPPPAEDVQLVLRCIGDLAPGETLDVRETSRPEKEQWIQLARERSAEIASSDPCPEAYAEIQALALYPTHGLRVARRLQYDRRNL